MAYYRIVPDAPCFCCRVLIARRCYRAGRRLVAFRAERYLSRRALRGSVSVQFWMFASPVAYSSRAGAAALALALWAEPDGRSDRGLSLGAYRPRVAPGPLMGASAVAVCWCC